MLVLWGIRFFVFRLQESPRYLVARGMDAEAVAVLHQVAAFNGKECFLTVDQLTALGPGELVDRPIREGVGYRDAAVGSVKSSWVHVKGLFRTRKMAWSTSLLIFLWGQSPS